MKEGESKIPQEVILSEAIKKARQVYICGNGGSASTSEHFATDLVKKGIKAFALSANTSVITMIANDYGYEQIFSRQLLTFAMPEDLLITISCSGTSPNIVGALEIAKELGLKTYSFETFGRIKDYGLLEDRHLQLAHRTAKLL